MAAPDKTPALVVRANRNGPTFEAVFWHKGHDDKARQVWRRVGPAWLVPIGSPEAKPNGKTEQTKGEVRWIERSGKPPEGYYTHNSAAKRAAELLTEYVNEVEDAERIKRERAARGLTFRELTADYLTWLETEHGAKPATLIDHRLLLAEPGTPHKRGAGRSAGHIMAALGDKQASKITREDVKKLLATIAKTGVSPRAVNKVRNLVGAIFAYGIKDRDLTSNPVVGIEPRRERKPAPLLFYSPEDVEAIARAMADGLHRQVQVHHDRDCGSRHGAVCDCSPAYQAAGRRFADPDEAREYLRRSRTADEITDDRQDAEAVRVSAYAGLRLGELLALRWRDIDWAGSAITVSRALSAGVEGPTKSGHVRRVPLSDQAAAALDRLSKRENFREPDDLVFCSVLGRIIAGAALRRRYRRAQTAIEARPLRWHDLRHSFGSLLVASGVDLVSVKDAMGHSDLKTTGRYLHARPASERAAQFSRAFSTSVTGAVEQVDRGLKRLG